MEKGFATFRTEISTMEFERMAKDMKMGFIYFRMEKDTKGSSITAINKESGNTSTLTATNMKENG